MNEKADNRVLLVLVLLVLLVVTGVVAIAVTGWGSPSDDPTWERVYDRDYSACVLEAERQGVIEEDEVVGEMVPPEVREICDDAAADAADRAAGRD